MVTEVAFYGHDSSYTVRLGDQHLLVRGAAGPYFAVGDGVDVRFSGPATASYPLRTAAVTAAVN